MTVNRRDFLRAGATVAAMAAVPRPLLVKLDRVFEPQPPIQDPRLQDLAGKALEAARSAGATYADVRLTHDWLRIVQTNAEQDSESMHVGVRTLVDGYWGFASSPVWSPDEMARLGREAVHQARTNALGKARVVNLAPAPAVQNGHWVMPVKVDPFQISPFEIQDFLRSLSIYTGRTPNVGVVKNQARFVMQEKAFASTEGSYCTQRLHLTKGTLVIRAGFDDGQQDSRSVDLLSPAGVGWELYRDQPLREAIRQLIAEMEADHKLPVKPVDVGRYDTVFDAVSVVNLIDGTLGPATELDRALGYEANAGGTSYLNTPFEMLGTYQAGAPLLTVTGNRSDLGGCATVQWDDEGVVPDEFPLVQDGVLVDFQTTRESAGWLEDYYAKTGISFRSHGCADAPSAIYAPLQHVPNLVMMPGQEALDFDGLVAGLTKGIAIKGAGFDMDFQHSSGLGMGRAYEVKNGKRVARIAGAGFLFRASELWKGLLAVGGSESTRRYGRKDVKGEPMQSRMHSVTAPPAVFKQLTLIDPLRKA